MRSLRCLAWELFCGLLAAIALALRRSGSVARIAPDHHGSVCMLRAEFACIALCKCNEGVCGYDWHGGNGCAFCAARCGPAEQVGSRLEGEGLNHGSHRTIF